jgi:hypothetical protein
MTEAVAIAIARRSAGARSKAFVLGLTQAGSDHAKEATSRNEP